MDRLDYTCRKVAVRISQILIRHEIKVAAQRSLDSERGTCRRIRIGSASGYHAQGPVALGMTVGGAIYSDARYSRTTGLFSNFFQCPPLQVIHRK